MGYMLPQRREMKTPGQFGRMTVTLEGTRAKGKKMEMDMRSVTCLNFPDAHEGSVLFIPPDLMSRSYRQNPQTRPRVPKPEPLPYRFFVKGLLLQRIGLAKALTEKFLNHRPDVKEILKEY